MLAGKGRYCVGMVRAGWARAGAGGAGVGALVIPQACSLGVFEIGRHPMCYQ